MLLSAPSPPLPQMHVLGMGEQLHPQALADRIAGTRWQRVVAVKPTGTDAGGEGRGWRHYWQAGHAGCKACESPGRPRPDLGLARCTRVDASGLRRALTRCCGRRAGWTWRASGKLDVRVEGCVTLVGVPYSEHSSFQELR
jgi:hypothetical protein